MPVRKTIWIAEGHDKAKHQFSSKKSACEFEKREKEDVEIKNGSLLLEKYFKTHFSETKQTDRYVAYCADCGKLLSKFDEEFDGYDRTSPGKELYSQPNKLFLDGFRCLKCDDKILRLFEKMSQFYFQKNKKILLISFDSLKHFSDIKRENQLELIRIVQCWHNRNKKNKNKDGEKTCPKTRLKT